MFCEEPENRGIIFQKGIYVESLEKHNYLKTIFSKSGVKLSPQGINRYVKHPILPRYQDFYQIYTKINTLYGYKLGEKQQRPLYIYALLYTQRLLFN